MRRLGRRNARGSSGTRDPYRLAAVNALTPYSRAKANVYTVDGVTGKVATLPDCVQAGTGIRVAYPLHAFAQATPAAQVALPSAVAGLGNRLALPFALAQYYVSSALAGAWKAAHDGTGWTAVTVLSRTTVVGVQFVWSTFGPTGETGSGVLTVGGSLFTQTYNAAANTVNAGGAGETAAATYNVSKFATADSPDANLYRRTASIASSNATAGVSAGDPAGTMVIGSDRSGSGSFLNAQLAECIFFNRSLSAPDLSAVQSYLATEYGLT
jgi:hypothetical protein